MEEDKLPNEILQTDDGTNTGVELDSAIQTNAVTPNGEYKISFLEGNLNSIANLGNFINQKTILLTKTILPLIETALIELLGNSSAFKEQLCQVSVTLEGATFEPRIEVDAVFSVELYIGTDVNEKAIAADASYILNRVKIVPNVEWTECSINCKNGEVKAHFIF